jgi:hypothetical protein
MFKAYGVPAYIINDINDQEIDQKIQCENSKCNGDHLFPEKYGIVYKPKRNELQYYQAYIDCYMIRDPLLPFCIQVGISLFSQVFYQAP